MLSSIPFTLPALRKAYAEGVSPVDVIDEVFERFAAVDDPAIFLHLCDQAALREQAAALGAYDPDAPLWGIPFAVKDNIDVAGIETTAGCPAYAYRPEQDAFVVAKLRAAGALMIGKTNLDQFATGLVGLRSPYGVPRNAVNPLIVPGGSSSGSGVIVGHGIVSFALGTDTAGSGRVPAALNNIVGLKPTLGALSASGVVPACRTLDTISIFALTVDDAHAVFAVARGYDRSDAYSKPMMEHAALSAPAKGLTVGIPDDASIAFCGDEVQRAAFARDVARLGDSGAEIIPIDFTPLYAVAEMLYEGAWIAERYTVIEALLTHDPQAVHPVTQQIVERARSLSAADAFRGIYRLAELKRAAEPLLLGLDMLCVPTIPTVYTVMDLVGDPIGPNSRLGTYTNFVNLLDMCGIAVPTTPRSDGLPGSVTLLAEAGRDAQIAAAARMFEMGCARPLGATAHPLPDPPPLAPAPSDQIEIAVCGAHMSGLPLNWQLTQRNGHLMRAARTAPHYRFYALAGGPPARPGLVRANGPEATSIALEVWSMPKTAFGSFMEGIPAPLGIGTVELDDGTWVKGFICEASGIAGATEISDLGDWRKYRAA